MKTSMIELCDTIATSIARYEKYRCWASKSHKHVCSSRQRDAGILPVASVRTSQLWSWLSWHSVAHSTQDAPLTWESLACLAYCFCKSKQCLRAHWSERSLCLSQEVATPLAPHNVMIASQVRNKDRETVRFGRHKSRRKDKNAEKFTRTSWFGSGFPKVFSITSQELSALFFFYRLLGHPKYCPLMLISGYCKYSREEDEDETINLDGVPVPLVFRISRHALSSKRLWNRQGAMMAFQRACSVVLTRTLRVSWIDQLNASKSMQQETYMRDTDVQIPERSWEDLASSSQCVEMK